MRSATWTMAAALAVSLLVNALALHRLSRKAPEAPVRTRPSPTETVFPAAPPPGVDKTDFIISELALLRRDVGELKSRNAPAEAPASVVRPSPDPDLARVLADQDRWSALWGDLDKLSAARRAQLIDDERHARSVLDLTADFLALHEPQRGAFLETARAVLRDLDKARRELEQTMRADPRPTREQSQAAIATYRALQNAGQERLAAQLDPNQPSQRQFTAQLPQWLRSVGGRDGRWFGP